ncbi:hypothetical protein F4054_12410 [Candidatus Poribacteria bacterium]|nr:hypothetical protein [Candidatus Poribacteria bacterium]MYG05463.1 hypothetical protein [Candidatus Poribacteria bacterium]MYK23046.1 hypothetical protein [Candidatus Poribacteria bacterium]
MKKYWIATVSCLVASLFLFGYFNEIQSSSENTAKLQEALDKHEGPHEPPVAPPVEASPEPEPPETFSEEEEQRAIARMLESLPEKLELMGKNRDILKRGYEEALRQLKHFEEMNAQRERIFMIPLA